jgi:hypothetical protein
MPELTPNQIKLVVKEKKTCKEIKFLQLVRINGEQQEK